MRPRWASSGCMPMQHGSGRAAALLCTTPPQMKSSIPSRWYCRYLQYYLGNFTLVPIVMGPGDINAYAKAIEPLLDDMTLLVASSDLSHYLPQYQAQAKDRQTIDMIRQLKGDNLTAENNRACGAVPIRVILEFARKKGWEPVGTTIRQAAMRPAAMIR